MRWFDLSLTSRQTHNACLPQQVTPLRLPRTRLQKKQETRYPAHVREETNLQHKGKLRSGHGPKPGNDDTTWKLQVYQRASQCSCECQADESHVEVHPGCRCGDFLKPNQILSSRHLKGFTRKLCKGTVSFSFLYVEPVEKKKKNN